MKLVILLACLSYAAAKSNGQPFWFRPEIGSNLGSLLANHFNSGRRPNRPDSGLSQHTKPLRPAVSSVQCGVQAIQPISSYIVGGEEARENSWPWMVSLQDRYGNHFCGGSLVQTTDNNYAVVTAAHCVLGAGASDLSVVLGEHSMRRYSGSEQTIQVNTILVHGGYDSFTLRNDIAVLHLSHPPSINSYVSPICIASADYTANEMATVTGWGTLSSGGKLPDVLHQVEKPIISDNLCYNANGPGFDSTTMLCAGDLPNGGIDSCQGDSGGPLMVVRKGRYELTGVVSWGYGCAVAGRPGVYADVYNIEKMSRFLNYANILY